MKLKTISGETLRAQFTDFECHALKHAAAYCQNGETFTGIPTSSNAKYVGSTETFTVIENSEEIVTIRREKTGLCLTACKSDGSTRSTRKPEAERPERAERPEHKEEATTAGNPAEMLTAAIQALAGGVTPAAIAALKEEVAALKEELAALKNQPAKVHEIKLPEKVEKVEGITHPKYDEVLAMIAEGENVYLYGPAGSGKNVLCEQIAKGLGIPFYYQNTVLTKFDLSGFKNAVGDFEKTEFFEAFTHGGLFMLDEVDNSTAEAMVALNAALANGYYSFPGIGRVDVHPDFRCIAAGNTIGTGADSAYCGRYKLDASSRDRFCFEGIEYCEEIEKAITAGDNTGLIVFAHDLRRAIQEVGAEIIFGYRGISRLHKWQKVFGFKKCIKKFITKGLEEVDKDTIVEVQDALRRLNTAETYWHCAFYQILD